MKLLVAVAGAWLVAFSGGCDVRPSGPPRDISGTLQVFDGVGFESDLPADGSECITGGTGVETPDVIAGATLHLEDGSGNIIATTQLGTGTIKLVDPEGQVVPTTTCYLPFTFSSVPDVNFYELHTNERRLAVYSAEDLAGQEWIISEFVPPLNEAAGS